MADFTPFHVVVFIGSTRAGRNAERVTKFCVAALEARGYKVSTIDPIQLQLPVLEKCHFHYRGDDKPPEKLEAAAQAADAFVIVSGEYNHSIPPALSNTMSHFGASKYAFKPASIVTYSVGPWGGMRAAMQLRAFLSELGLLTVSNLLGFAEVHKVLNEDGTPQVDPEGWTNKVNKNFDQLEWLMTGLKAHRAVKPPPQ